MGIWPKDVAVGTECSKICSKIIEGAAKDRVISTVEPQFNKLLYNEVLDIMNGSLQPSQGYSKMHRAEPQYNKP